jgi:hypothetical protein
MLHPCRTLSLMQLLMADEGDSSAGDSTNARCGCRGTPEFVRDSCTRAGVFSTGDLCEHGSLSNTRMLAVEQYGRPQTIGEFQVFDQEVDESIAGSWAPDIAVGQLMQGCCSGHGQNDGIVNRPLRYVVAWFSVVSPAVGLPVYRPQLDNQGPS